MAQGLPSGSTLQRKSTRTTINDDLQLLLDDRPVGNTGITISGLVGGNLYAEEAAYVQDSGSGIVIPGYYNVSNFATQTESASTIASVDSSWPRIGQT